MNAQLSFAANNFSADPKLDASWRLTDLTNNACVDAGTASEAPATDLDGESRPQGGGIDVGADEAG